MVILHITTIYDTTQYAPCKVEVRETAHLVYFFFLPKMDTSEWKSNFTTLKTGNSNKMWGNS